MKEPHVEAVANHDGPESCVRSRKGEGEALTGVRAGRVLSREINEFEVPTLLTEAEGNTSTAVIARRWVTSRGRVPRASEEGRARSRRRDVGAVRGEPGGQPPRSPRAAPPRAYRARPSRRGATETFSFLGFTHLCAKSKTGRFLLARHTVKARMRAKLHEVKAQMQRRRHLPIPEQGRWLGQVVRGHFAYYAAPTNIKGAGALSHPAHPLVAPRLAAT